MAEIPPIQRELIEQLTKDYLTKIPYISQSNQGIFHALTIIAKDAEILELQIILCISKKEPISAENLIKELNLKVSRSTIYRRLNFLISKQLIERD